MFRDVELGGTAAFGFATNDTGGSGADFTTASAVARLCGTTTTSTASAITSGLTTYLLSDSSFPSGAGEVSIAATSGNGFAAGNYYSIYVTLTCDSETPTGMVGQLYVSTASKGFATAAGRVMDALNSDGAKITSGQSVASAGTVSTVSTASYVTTVGDKTSYSLAADQSAVTFGTLSNAGALATAATQTAQNTTLGTVNTNVASVLADTGTDGVKVAADQSGVTLGTVSNVNAFTTAAKAELQSEANDALTAFDFSGKTVGTATNVGSVATVTGSVTVGSNLDKTNYSLGAAGLLDIYQVDTSTLTDGGSIGKLLVDANSGTLATVNTNVKSILSDTGTDGVVIGSGQTVASAGTVSVVGTLTNVGNIAAAIGSRTPDSGNAAGTYDWSIALMSQRYDVQETATASGTSTYTMKNETGSATWGTFVVRTSSTASYVTGTGDS